MSPVVFRYHSPDSPSDSVESRRYYSDGYDHYYTKHKYYSDHELRQRSRTPDYVYGDKVFHDSHLTQRSYTPPPHHRRHHHSHPNHHRHRRPRDSYEHHKPHIHYITAKSEPNYKHGSPRIKHPMEVTTYQERPDTYSEPRITLYDSRERRRRTPHWHSCPEKSSKAIPSMYYDELRCPHCAAHVQPSQDEVLAYPWSVQSYRPNRQRQQQQQEVEKNNKLPSIANGSMVPKSGVNDPNATVVDRRSEPAAYARQGPKQANSFVDKALPPALSKSNPQTKKPMSNATAKPPPKSIRLDRAASMANKENDISVVAPTMPMFRNDNDVMTRSELKPGSQTVRVRGSNNINKPPPLTVVSEREVDDDISPFDSVSNVVAPVLRANSIEDKPAYYLRHRPRIRAETEVDATYPQEKYFKSLDNHPYNYPGNPFANNNNNNYKNDNMQAYPFNNPANLNNNKVTPRRLPQQHLRMPHPAKDSASQISRMLKGQYYDRLSGQKYEYNVSWDKSRMYSDYKPITGR